MIPFRHFHLTNHHQGDDNDALSLTQPQIPYASAPNVNMGTGIQQPGENGLDSFISQQLRVLQANNQLLLAARRENDELSFARQSLASNQQQQHLHHHHHEQAAAAGLQNSGVSPAQQHLLNQLTAGMHQGMGMMNDVSAITMAQPQSVLSQAYRRGREEVLRSYMQQRGSNSEIGIGSHDHNTQLLAALPNDYTSRSNKIEQPDLLEAIGASSIERRKKNASYFDASSIVDPDPTTLANRRTRGGVTEPFPERLHRMLEESEKEGQSAIVSFLPHGRAFAIHNQAQFSKEVMPKYFKQSRLSSFQRQLNLYGFTRITNGPDAGGYYHELFLKGRPALSIYMRRVGVPQATSKHRSIRPTGNTPDFYNMKPLSKGGVATAAALVGRDSKSTTSLPTDKNNPSSRAA